MKRHFESILRILNKLNLSLFTSIICSSLIVLYSCKSDFVSEFGGGELLWGNSTDGSDSTWDYPVKPGMDTWNALQTEEERIAALQVPESVLLTLLPAEVVRLCITFPSFGHFTAWNTPQVGFDLM